MTRILRAASATTCIFLALAVTACSEADKTPQKLAYEAKGKFEAAPVAAAPGKGDIAHEEEEARKRAEAAKVEGESSAAMKKEAAETAKWKAAPEKLADNASGEKPSPAAASRPATGPEPAVNRTLPMSAPVSGTAAPPSSPLDEQVKRIDEYLSSLRTAAYAFNPPSPIKVAKPVTVHFWLDPGTTAAKLADELGKIVPRDAERIESGETKWGPKMRAVLSGPDFDVKPVPGSPEEQPVSTASRTTWSWNVTPLRPGDNQTLHLRLQVVLPPEIGGPKTITTLDREIRVEVTLWWLFDTYFEKYWKWLLGGLGAALSGVIAWWWENRRGAR